MIRITGLPWPPTMNHRMIPFGGRLILSKEHREYKKTLQMFLMKNCMTLDAGHLVGKKLKAEVRYIGPESAWFTKKGEIKKKDVENRHKALLDGVMPFFDLDDSQIFELTIKKQVSNATETTASILIEEMEE